VLFRSPNEFTPGGPPNLLIPNKDPRPVINQNQTVKDVLNRLHNRSDKDTQDTQDETTTNNDRLLSDTTASESKKKGGRKKKPLMQI
jgi:hypothetical protein